MSSPRNIPSFCLFCYKGISSYKTDNSYEIKKFCKFLSRLVKSDQRDNQLVIQPNNTLELINCCENCELHVLSFCDLYNQIMCLEMRLDAKLNTILEKIELSNKTPSRWMNVKNALQLTFNDNIDKISESRMGIMKIRQDVLQLGLRRSAKSQPRVSVERLDQETFKVLYHPTIEKDSSLCSPHNSDNISDNWSNGLNISVEIDPDIEIKQEYPPSPFSKTDNAIPIEATSISQPKANVNRGATYVNCEICGKKVAALLKNKHYKMSHDLSKVAHEYQIFRCNTKDCTAYFLTKRQLKEHNSDAHDTKRKVSNEPSAEYLGGVKYFRCEICKTPFDNLQTYKRHVSSTNCGVENVKTSTNVVCPECREKFDTKNDLWVHQYEVHSTEKRTICPKCGKFFNEKRRFTSHMEYHKGPTQWKWECKECGKRSATVHQLKRHILIHKKDDEDWAETDFIIEHESGGENYEMEENGHIIDRMKLESTPSNLLAQTEISKEPNSITLSAITIKCVCSQCGKRFSAGVYLKRHMTRVHNSTSGVNWQCGKCGKKFVNKWNMTSHLKLHKMETKSKPNHFSRQGNRKNRFNSSLGDKSTETAENSDIDNSNCCDASDNTHISRRTSIDSNHSLEINIKEEPLSEDYLSQQILSIVPSEFVSLKTAETQIECLECGDILENEKKLWLHQSEVHLKNVCKLCGKEYALKTGLNLHLEYHKDPQDWKWKCDECGKKCPTKHKLKEHARTHAGIKLHFCHLCKERFGFPHNLRRHLKKQHGATLEIKPRVRKEKTSSRVTCQYCKGEFAHRASLKRHCKLMHKDINEDTAQSQDIYLNSLNVEAENSLEHPMEILP